MEFEVSEHVLTLCIWCVIPSSEVLVSWNTSMYFVKSFYMEITMYFICFHNFPVSIFLSKRWERKLKTERLVQELYEEQIYTRPSTVPPAVIKLGVLNQRNLDWECSIICWTTPYSALDRCFNIFRILERSKFIMFNSKRDINPR